MRKVNTILLDSNKRRDSKRKATKGFTLIELLLALAAASIVMAAIFGIYGGLTRSFTSQNVAAQVQQTARASIDLMAADIMMAGFNPGEITGSGILDAQLNRIQFTIAVDSDGDDQWDSVLDTITYELVGTQLQYTNSVGGPTAILDNVRALEFTYLPAAAPLADIRTVEIILRVEEPAGRGGPVIRSYNTRVRCRNLGL
jgi:type IV pilus assembly protein PilW